ncbi:UDP-N-acetylmuramoyl-L-alanine--D-glutamate ligase [Luteimonas sp. RIT-PG2_3]
MRFSRLDGQRVALWGWGREGRAAYRAIRHDPGLAAPLPLTVFCSPAEADEIASIADPLLTAQTRVDGDLLAAFDIVIKSPGISPYREEAVAAAARGTRFLGGTALWFSAHADARTICVTGTKGKSTTTALLAHLLRAGGHRTALTGNIGQPLLELADAEAEFWAIELSSYQTGDVAASGVHPEIAVVTNVFPEHLDWHGSEQRYIDDKLALLTAARPRIAVLNAQHPLLAGLSLPDSRICWYGREDGWHLRGDALYHGDDWILDGRAVPVPGRHNRSNLCAVLTAIDALGLDARAMAPAAVGFVPLPHRLQTLGVREGLTWVNDSISTTPHASLAALEVFAGRKIALLVGGHDRGLDWADFAARMGEAPPALIVTMGQNGPRIHALLAAQDGAPGFRLASAADLPTAIALAREVLEGDGVVLLSPGAPSFGAYRDYAERGRHFAQLAGFDPDLIAQIPGMGVSGG